MVRCNDAEKIVNQAMKFQWKKNICLLAIIFSTLVCKESNAAMNEKPLKLPKIVKAWQIFGSPKQVDASNIFEYMNGAGELYLAYRFEKLEVYKYEAVDQEGILAEVYFMETSDDAFGLLSQDWEGEGVETKSSRVSNNKGFRAPRSRAIYDSGLLRIASGKIYARILTLAETPESKEAVFSIGRVIMREESDLYEPGLLGTLPENAANEWQLQDNEIRYFRSNLVLSSFYYLSFENMLNLGPSSEAVTAIYEKRSGRKKDESIRVVIVNYENSKKASHALNRFCKIYLSEYRVMESNNGMIGSWGYFQVEDGWMGYELKNDFLAFVFQCPDERTARSVIASIVLNINEIRGEYEK